MITATVVIRVKYAPDADMEEAEDDKRDFDREFRNFFGSSIARWEDLSIEHTIAEVQEKT